MICARWAKALRYDTARVIRQRLAMVLEQRGEDPNQCDDPADDERQMLRMAAEKLAEANAPPPTPFEYPAAKQPDADTDTDTIQPARSSSVPTWQRDQTVRCKTRAQMGITERYKTTCR